MRCDLYLAILYKKSISFCQKISTIYTFFEKKMYYGSSVYEIEGSLFYFCSHPLSGTVSMRNVTFEIEVILYQIHQNKTFLKYVKIVTIKNFRNSKKGKNPNKFKKLLI